MATLFGQTARGRKWDSGATCSITWAKEGDETHSCGSRSAIARFIQLDGGTICYWWPESGRDCRVFLRNQEGSYDQQNEFLLVSPWWRFQFSIAK